MIDLKLYAINALMQKASITAVHAQAGALLIPGTPLLDLRIDLSDAALHDCPPASSYRLSLREALWLREMTVAVGDEVEVGALLATFTVENQAAYSDKVVRGARVAVAAIVSEPDWWDGPALD